MEGDEKVNVQAKGGEGVNIKALQRQDGDGIHNRGAFVNGLNKIPH